MIGTALQHLFISTAFVILAAAIVWICNTDGPAFRYWLWFAAALKFGIPTGIFTQFGSWVHQVAPKQVVAGPIPYPPGAEAFSRVSRVFSLASTGHNSLWRGLIVLWLLGTVSCLLVWIIRLRFQRPVSTDPPRSAAQIVSKLCRQMGLRRSVTVRSAVTGYDLALYGIFKSVILVPPGFCDFLESAELEAILTHELVHIRRWDNLAAVVVHVLACIFWFHPALWWIERKLIVERGLACDEAVVDQGSSADSYAAGILKVCTFQSTELRAGACGFSSSSLQQRMERIMSYTSTSGKRHTAVILGVLGAIVMLAPATIGFFDTRAMYGQSGEALRNHAHRAITCVFADKRYPEGAIIHQEGGHQQLCVEAFGKPLWVRTSAETRQRGQSVVELAGTAAPQVAFCTPKASTSKNTCSCEDGGTYSPGSIVDSSNGKLSCSAGRWGPFPQIKK